MTGASSGIGEATARRLARESTPTHPVRLVLVARREERLRALAAELGGVATVLALDLLEEDAPARVRAQVEAELGSFNLLVNNAGAAYPATFAEGGWENVERNLALNVDAPIRLTEALLPLLRASAPSAVVNVGSVAGRIPRPESGGYSAAKAAMNAWSDALRAEEAGHGVHVGLVLPGFVATEGFPHRSLTAKRRTAWTVGTPEAVAEAILEVGPGRRAERYVPRGYGALSAMRTLAPALVRRILAS